MSKSPFLVALVTSMLAVAPVYGDDESNQKDLDQHQGTWTIVSEEFDGKPLPPGESAGLTRVVKGSEVTRTKGQVSGKSILRLDASKQPKRYDAEIVEGPGQGQIIHGIYEFDGDLLKMCADVAGKARPSEFVTSPGSQRHLQVWRRRRP